MIGILRRAFSALSGTKVDTSVEEKQDDGVLRQELEKLDQIVSPIILNGLFVRFSVPLDSQRELPVKVYRTEEEYHAMWSSKGSAADVIFNRGEVKKENFIIPFDSNALVLVGTPRVDKMSLNCYDLDFVTVPYSGAVLGYDDVFKSGVRRGTTVSNLSREQVMGAVESFVKQCSLSEYNCLCVDHAVAEIEGDLPKLLQKPKQAKLG